MKWLDDELIERRPRDRVIVEVEKVITRPRRRWLFQFPEYPNDRRQVRTICSFFESYKTQPNRKNKKGDWVLYLKKDWWEYEMERINWFRTCEEINADESRRIDPEKFLDPYHNDNWELTPVASIYEFFDIIGYDYKTRKYK